MRITNAHQNNLKHIDLTLPENQLIVVTGLSGSGKSSLAMGVIANEGYRHFLESLPAYTQQNSQLIPTAEVDDITDLPPVIKVEQSKRFQSTHATFGTLSELAAVFRILFARYSAEETMSKSLFSFNHPKGACEVCRGIGEAEYIDINKLIGNENKTLREGAITTTLPNGYIVYSQITVDELNKVCQAHGFSVDVPWKDLTDEQRDVVLNGSERVKVFYGKHSLESRLRWEGIKAKPREEGYYKGMMPIMEDILRRDRNPNILKFASAHICPSCKGARIKAEHLKFKWQSLNFAEWMDLPLEALHTKLKALKLSAGEQVLVERITTQLFDLIKLGMGEYQLSSPSVDISSGDAQRIKLVNQLSSRLQGMLYVFDEPSIGLPADYQIYLRHMLNRLIKRGNTVMVVEHDLNFIRSADWILELGPDAGIHGGEVVFNGSIQEFLQAKKIDSPTLKALEADRSKENQSVQALKVDIETFHPEAGKLTVISRKTPESVSRLSKFCEEADLNLLTVNDQPIGKTPRSNPATYTGLADKIRDLLAKTKEAKALKLAKGAFSFNNKTGRCPTCEGAGVITLSMSMMGSVNQVCPSCNGKRFKQEVLKVHWQEKTIADIYNLSVEEAFDFFEEEKPIRQIIDLMLQLGLGYLKLGQPSNTLSGGEAQRIKLTKHFAKKSKSTLLVLEEPSIGLHYQNVRQLLKALHLLKDQTAGIVCFENHQLFQQAANYWINNAKTSAKEHLEEEAEQSQEVISIKGARTHNLKNLNLELPKQQLTVVSGISGSGKSSLVIDTLHGFGLQEMTRQFSSYQQSRVGVNFQFEVDEVMGLTPTICVTRKEKSFSLRSDIAKQTGIDKLLRFAFSRKAQFEGDDLSASHFSNEHELGRCSVCEGVGEEMIPDLNKIVPDTDKSITSGLLTHNKTLAEYGDPDSQYMAILKAVGSENGFDLDTAYSQLNEAQKQIFLYGTGERKWQTEWHYKTKTRTGTQQLNKKWEGLLNYLSTEYYMTRKNKNIESLKALFSPETCSNCNGSGLHPERLKYTLSGESIHAIKSMDFNELSHWLEQNYDSETIEAQLITKIKEQVQSTVSRARELHIDHLQLNRKSSTLSGGENQRVALIKQLNSPLKGITYLLDEPTAGLSQENIPDLLNILQELIRKGNSVIVIEHNKELIMAADHLVQIGPVAGKEGGYLIYEGSSNAFLERPECHPFLKTAAEKVELNQRGEMIAIEGIERHTLIKKSLSIPVGGITAISGKSGIGKTTLVKEILIPSIKTGKASYCEQISFPKQYTDVHYFEPKKLRSYASTLLVDYLGLLGEITRQFAAETSLKAKDFSYKTKSSQCPNCNGKGYIETSLDVAANAIEKCEVCDGQRYKPSILIHQLGSHNIAEVLAMNLTALDGWLRERKSGNRIFDLLHQLTDVGLGHLRLDQPVQSLSSGERQRLLLLKWIEEQASGELFILDEPSIGLHYADIDLMFAMLERLSAQNDVLVIDHNPYLLKKIGVGLKLE
ncbi:hypothetical protein GCM10027429_15930 [Marivirga atlantica]|uniref:UvrABC system protein A n=1 Tax=Marivirga atlantica TaxID=1548457 RepID=A0A937AEH1_9BACT|nr:ATP-binding cassette domain-containing protein [Marivirga atlantica]MBL0765211.1 ATP-binding cassette domain-containing protein [Marivirga atlantica]